ncbi:MAG: DNA polymerase I, partial [Clostridiales bacterium]|nr:DNA polymerase I [Clostridiales bacterium]
DVHAPTFRHKMYDAYKGTRKPMDPELREQVPLMKEMLHAMGFKTVELEGYEADDVLGTLAARGEREGMEVSVVSGDRDLLQLATEHVRIRIPKTKMGGTTIEDYYADDVKARYQVTPTEFIDVKALMGDTADNIPGVPGIGEKTATALIVQYKNIEEVHAHADEVKPPRASKNIVEFWEQALLSKELATIDVDVPLEYDFSDAAIESAESLYTPEAYALCKRLEFKNFLARFNIDDRKKDDGSFEKYFTLVEKIDEAEKIWERAKNLPVGFYAAINDGGGLFSLSVTFSENDTYLFIVNNEISEEFLFEKLLDSSERNLSTRDLKKTLSVLPIKAEPGDGGEWENYLRRRARFFDTAVAAYLLNPIKGDYPCEDIARDCLGIDIPSRQELLGKQTIVQEYMADRDKALRLACLESYVAWKSAPVLEEKLKNQGMYSLFTDMEMPLVFVLSDMEKEGIRMDGDALTEYGQKLSVSIAELEKKIYAQAGEEFNINSPKQLGVILFEKMHLPNGKKTKTGYSTAADVLEKLAPDHPIVADILEYRQLTKLKSTYADGLVGCVAADGKIHTTFNQTITATGRLSSTDPNLQNIPIRIELGKLIRKVFHAGEGNVFVDSDYSQIELRLLAHMSGDENLIQAFREGKDIHRSTASLVFNTPFDEVTPLQRRNAKAVNFGIVYGISAFGLAQDIGIGRATAQKFIDDYFRTYPKIKSFLDGAVASAKEKGYTKTLYGRIRPVPELASSNFMQRQFGERVAMNAPIQGTAADIIKIAMIRVHDRLIREGYKSRLILQVHDELLVEAAEDEKDKVIALLEEEMSGAAELSVELSVGTETGYNWYDAH